MKKLMTLLLAFSMLFTLVACGGGNTNSTAPAEKPAAADDTGNTSAGESTADNGKIKIGFSMKTLQEERWQRELEHCEAAAEELGVELIVQVANNESEKQISQIENLATQGIDILMLVPVDSGGLSTVLNDLHSQGVYIMGYDQECENAWCDSYVGYDAYSIGRQIASVASEKQVPGNYAFLLGDKAAGTAVNLMTQGFYDELDPMIESGKAKVVMEQNCKEWKAEEGLAYAENALSANNNEIAGFICMNDGIASGAIQALDAQGLAGQCIVTGQDAELTAIQRIAAGTQTSTLFKDTKVLSRKAIEIAVKTVKGEDLGTDKTMSWGVNEFPWVIVDTIVVTKDNVDSVIIDGGVFTKEEIYGG